MVKSLSAELYRVRVALKGAERTKEKLTARLARFRSLGAMPSGGASTPSLTESIRERYNTTPVLIETFVETPRYTGAVYRASGWIHVGTTQGRGRYDRDKLYEKPRKDVWLRPLRRDWRRTLNR